MIYYVSSDHESELFADYYENTRVTIRVYNNGEVYCSSLKIEVLNDYMKSQQFKNLLDLIVGDERVDEKD